MTPSSREYLSYLAWRRGHKPQHRPTWADLMALAYGLGDESPAVQYILG